MSSRKKRCALSRKRCNNLRTTWIRRKSNFWPPTPNWKRRTRPFKTWVYCHAVPFIQFELESELRWLLLLLSLLYSVVARDTFTFDSSSHHQLENSFSSSPWPQKESPPPLFLNFVYIPIVDDHERRLSFEASHDIGTHQNDCYFRQNKWSKAMMPASSGNFSSSSSFSQQNQFKEYTYMQGSSCWQTTTTTKRATKLVRLSW